MADFFSNFFGANPTAGQQPTFFDDPRQLGLMALATGLMQASGQQPMGVSRGGMIGQSLMGGAQLGQQAQRNQMMNKLYGLQAGALEDEAKRQKGWPAKFAQMQGGGAPMPPVAEGLGLEAPGAMGSMGGLMAGSDQVAAGSLFGPLMADPVGRAILEDPKYGPALATKFLSSKYGADGQEKFGNTPIWGTDAQGNSVLMQPSSRGGVKQVDLPPGVTPQRGQTSRIDLGDKWAIQDATGATIGYMPKSVPPEQTPALKGAQEKAKVIGKTEGERAVQAPVAAAELEGKFAPLDRLSESVDDVINHPGLKNVTGLMSAVPIIPGSERANAQAKMKKVRSQVAQSVLQMYRETSKTGGAVGQVSNFEQQMFQDNLAALDQAQTYEEFKKELGNIKNFVAGSKARLRKAYEMEFGASQSQQPAPAGGIRFLGFE